MKINVLHVYKTCFPYSQGGIEEVIEQLCRATTKLGISNKIVCISKQCKKKEVVETHDATIYCYPMSFEIASCSFSWSLWLDFRDLSEWADVIHYQFPWPFADILALTRQKNSTPYIVSYQSDVIRQKNLKKLYRPLMNKFLANAASIVATSKNYIASSIVLSNLKGPIVCIPNGIDSKPAHNTYINEKRIYEKYYGNNFFLFVGVFRYYKGLEYLLEAAKKSGLEVVIAGEGPQTSEVKKFIKENDLRNVHLTGKVSDQQKYALIDISKAFILPSSERSEAYGMVLVEALRQGKAIISTELGSGTSYINIHEDTGLVVSAKNASELASAMTYMAKNRHEVKQMCLSSKKRFEEHFTSEIMGSRYAELYKSVM